MLCKDYSEKKMQDENEKKNTKLHRQKIYLNLKKYIFFALDLMVCPPFFCELNKEDLLICTVIKLSVLKSLHQILE